MNSATENRYPFLREKSNTSGAGGRTVRVTIFEPQNIIKCKAVRGLSNKEMPLHGSQVKTNKRKDSIIWARFSLERLQKKCGIDATKNVPLATVSSKAFRNKRTHMMLMLP